MMTIEHIQDAVRNAKAAGDVSQLQDLSQKLESHGTAKGMAMRAYALGFADELSGNFKHATEQFQRALALDQDLGDRRILAEVLSSLANSYDRSSQKQKAMEQWQSALSCYEDLGDKASCAISIHKIAALHQQAGNFTQSLAEYRRAIELYEELGDRIAAARTTGDAGSVYYYLSDYANALEHWQRAVAVFEETGDLANIARVTGNMGNVQQSIGNFDEAAVLYRRALDLHQQLGNTANVANVTRNLAIGYRNTGSYDLALEYYGRALLLFEDLGNKNGIAQTTSSIGLVHYDIGDFSQAITHLHRSLKLHEELGERAAAAHVNGLIGGVYSYTGDKTLALDYLQRALMVHKELDERSSIARVTGNIGLIYSKNRDYSTALEFYHRALALHEEIGNLGSVLRVRCSMIKTLIEAEMIAEAESILSVIDMNDVDDPSDRISLEMSRAMIQRHHGLYDAAMQTLESALAISQAHSRPADQADIHGLLRDLCEPRQDLSGYIRHNKEFMLITAEINGRDTAIKLAIQEKQREMDAVHREHQRQLTVLHSTLPVHIADRVARGEKVNDQHDNTAVLFMDVAGFTSNSSQLDAGSVVDLLQKIFTSFDAICSGLNVMKIKTIGDAYMAVAFPSEHHVADLAAAAQAMISSNFYWPHTGERVQFRIGLHIGTVIAGVLGTERIQYDVWGDTVNVASRMESTSEPGRIHVSEAFAIAIKTSPPSPLSSLRGGTNIYGDMESDVIPSLSEEHGTWHLALRGETELKGKGIMTTYWLEGTA